MLSYHVVINQLPFQEPHRIGLWVNLQESPIFDGKNHGFL